MGNLSWHCIQLTGFFMIDIKVIKERTRDQDFWDFSEFVISQAEGGNFPDYKAMDLMKIARLVHNIWVFDFRNGLEDGLVFHFSGTKIDELFGRNITGLDFEKIYPGEHRDELINQTYHQVYLQKRPCYTKRFERYHDDLIDKYTTIETLMFPCSADGENIDFGLGMTKYTQSEYEGEAEFMLL